MIHNLLQMPQLEKKLDQELGIGSSVIACRFPFPSWKPDRTIGEGIDAVWIYNVSKEKSNAEQRSDPH